MSTNDPMTQERLNEIQGRVGMMNGNPPVDIWAELIGARKALAYHAAPQDLMDLLADNERLRALTTVDDAMVERAARAMMDASPDSAYITDDEHDWYVHDARAVLDAALGPREGS